MFWSPAAPAEPAPPAPVDEVTEAFDDIIIVEHPSVEQAPSPPPAEAPPPPAEQAPSPPPAEAPPPPAEQAPSPPPAEAPPPPAEQAPPPPAAFPTSQEVRAKRAAVLHDADAAARRKEPAYIAEREEAIRRAVMRAARDDFAKDLPTGRFIILNTGYDSRLGRHDHELFPFMKSLVPGYKATLTDLREGEWMVEYVME
jgi:hypothetical protein